MMQGQKNIKLVKLVAH